MNRQRTHDQWLFHRCLLSGLAAVAIFLLFAPAFATSRAAKYQNPLPREQVSQELPVRSLQS
jgi:hypothetical protein